MASSFIIQASWNQAYEHLSSLKQPLIDVARQVKAVKAVKLCRRSCRLEPRQAGPYSNRLNKRWWDNPTVRTIYNLHLHQVCSDKRCVRTFQSLSQNQGLSLSRVWDVVFCWSIRISFNALPKHYCIWCPALSHNAFLIKSTSLPFRIQSSISGTGNLILQFILFDIPQPWCGTTCYRAKKLAVQDQQLLLRRFSQPNQDFCRTKLDNWQNLMIETTPLNNGYFHPITIQFLWLLRSSLTREQLRWTWATGQAVSFQLLLQPSQLLSRREGSWAEALSVIEMVSFDSELSTCIFQKQWMLLDNASRLMRKASICTEGHNCIVDEASSPIKLDDEEEEAEGIIGISQTSTKTWP